MPKRQLISFDWAMKRLLRSKANFVVLEGFLSELLRDEIEILEILDGESNADTSDSKVTRVDMLVRDHLGRKIIIELQHTRQGDFLQRMLYYASRVVSESLSQGKPYAEVGRVVSINIVYFDVGLGSDYVYLGRNEFRGLHTQDVLTLTEDQRHVFGCDDVAEIFPEYYILRVNQFNDVARDGLDEWIYFLKNEEIPPSFKAKGLRQAKEMLDVMKLSVEERRAYEVFEDDLHQQASLYEEYIAPLVRAEQEKAEAKQREEEAKQREEKERRQKEEERRQKEESLKREEEARRQKKQLADVALKALIAAGVSEAEARRTLGV